MASWESSVTVTKDCDVITSYSVTFGVCYGARQHLRINFAPHAVVLPCVTPARAGGKIHAYTLATLYARLCSSSYRRDAPHIVRCWRFQSGAAASESVARRWEKRCAR